jgi:hypothetical protein
MFFSGVKGFRVNLGKKVGTGGPTFSDGRW